MNLANGLSFTAVKESSPNLARIFIISLARIFYERLYESCMGLVYFLYALHISCKYVQHGFSWLYKRDNTKILIGVL